MTSLTALLALRTAIEQFKAWAERFPTKQNAAEWECDYEHWPEIEMAFDVCLDASPPADWNQEAVDLLLYVIARSNENSEAGE